MCPTLLHCPPPAQDSAPQSAVVTRIGVEDSSGVLLESPIWCGSTGRWSVVEDVEESGGLSQPRPPSAARRRPPARRTRPGPEPPPRPRPGPSPDPRRDRTPAVLARPDPRRDRTPAVLARPDPRRTAISPAPGGTGPGHPGRHRARPAGPGSEPGPPPRSHSRGPRAAGPPPNCDLTGPGRHRARPPPAPHPGHTKRGRSRRTDPVEECGEPPSSGRSACPSGRSSGP